MKSPVLPVFPATGFMDTRSTPDEIPYGGHRRIENWHVTQKSVMQRMTGYRKFWDQSNYNNQDLHDQLTGIRQPIQMVTEARMGSGFSKVFCAVQNRIYALNNSSGNWVIIHDTCKEDTPSWVDNVWVAAYSEDGVIFTNDDSQPVGHLIDQGLTEPSCGEVPSSAPTLNHTNFVNWDVTGKVDLIGRGTSGTSLYPLIEVAGMYVDMCGTAGLGKLTSKETFHLTAGKTYKLTYYVAGNQRANRLGDQLRGQFGPFFHVSSPYWTSGMLRKTITATPYTDMDVQISFEQVAIGDAHTDYGCLLDNVTFENLTDGTVLLSDTFDDENPVEPGSDSGDSGVFSIKDLEELKITKAKVAVTWNGLTFLLNLEQDGVRRSNRFIWSDYKRPFSFVTSESSLAGYHDLPTGEVILNAASLQDSLLIFTDRSIWQFMITGATAENLATVKRRYAPDEAGSRCLHYWRTLVSDGSALYWMGRDGIYRYDLYTPVPQLVDYIHKASSIIYDDIHASCSLPCAGFYPKYRQIKFSWGTQTDDFPSQTMVIGTEFQFTSIEDDGFTAFSIAAPSAKSTVRDFILNNCICTETQLGIYGYGYVNEGGRCVPVTAPTCPDTYDYLLTDQTLDLGDGIIVEDYNQPAGPNALCKAIDGTLTDLCKDEFSVGQCTPTQMFVEASARDWCLKEAAEIYYREQCTCARATTCADCGTYTLEGYKSTLYSGALHFQAAQFYKMLTRLLLEMLSEGPFGTADGIVTVSVGSSAQSFDPVTATGNCNIFWEEQDPMRVKCLDDATVDINEDNLLAPDAGYIWDTYMRGRYLYYKIVISNPNTSPIDQGVAVKLSRLELNVTRTS